MSAPDRNGGGFAAGLAIAMLFFIATMGIIGVLHLAGIIR